MGSDPPHAPEWQSQLKTTTIPSYMGKLGDQSGSMKASVKNPAPDSEIVIRPGAVWATTGISAPMDTPAGEAALVATMKENTRISMLEENAVPDSVRETAMICEINAARGEVEVTAEELPPIEEDPNMSLADKEWLALPEEERGATRPSDTPPWEDSGDNRDDLPEEERVASDLDKANVIAAALQKAMQTRS